MMLNGSSAKKGARWEKVLREHELTGDFVPR